MKGLFRPLVVALGLALVGPPNGPARETRPEPPPTFPGDVELVTVDVVVTDKTGRPVPGLTVEDFTVEEEGLPQTVSSFEAVELPSVPSPAPPPRPRVSTNQVPRQSASRTFLVLFDDLHLTPEDALQAKGAVATFLRKGVREGDYVSLLATSGERSAS
jgi:VWFA-related protein